MKNWELCKALEEGRKFECGEWTALYEKDRMNPYIMVNKSKVEQPLFFYCDWQEVKEEPVTIREIMAFMAGSTRAFRYSKNGLWMINPSNDESDDYMTECEWCETSGPRAWEPRQFTREEMGI